jgi:hypothetical protein
MRLRLPCSSARLPSQGTRPRLGRSQCGTRRTPAHRSQEPNDCDGRVHSIRLQVEEKKSQQTGQYRRSDLRNPNQRTLGARRSREAQPDSQSGTQPRISTCQSHASEITLCSCGHRLQGVGLYQRPSFVFAIIRGWLVCSQFLQLWHKPDDLMW